MNSIKQQIFRLDLSAANKQTNGRHVHTSRLLRLQFKRHNKKMLCYGQARGQRPVRNANDQLKRSILILLYISKWYINITGMYIIIGTIRKLYTTYNVFDQHYSQGAHYFTNFEFQLYFCTWIDSLYIYVTINLLHGYVTSTSIMSLEYL